MSGPDAGDDLAQASAWLAAGAGGPVAADRVIQTHIGQVFLIGGQAFKLKKAAALGYLDFSTSERRCWAIGRELELNRAAAPDIYQAVRIITRQTDGGLAFDGPGEPLECVLQMRRFDPDAVLSNHAEQVSGDFAEALGRQIADLHAAATVTPGGARTLSYVVDSNADHLRDLALILGAQAGALIEQTQAAFDALADGLDERGRHGSVRRCHGDLHLGNILAEGGRAILFDCIEFNDRLSEIDVLYDLAFLLMDLGVRGQTPGANRVLNGYLDQAARAFGDRALSGLGALPLFLSARAAVRTHVHAQQGEFPAALTYLQAAIAHLRPAPARLVAIGGLSGAGKSTLARALAPRLGSSPGAVILRADEVRKRLWGCAPNDRLPQGAYTVEQSRRVYGRMLDEADLALAAGRSVVLDAVFLRPHERLAAEARAQARRVPFTGVWLEGPPQVLAARIAARVGDASDADAAVLAEQLGRDPGEIGWTRHQTADPQALAERLAGDIAQA